MSNSITIAREVIDTEIEGLKALEEALDQRFVDAVEMLHAIKGRVIISGMGKSGHVARKIAATMASCGTPAHFVHPGEASHGDLGMVTKEDALILLSNSGETAELKDMIYYAKRFSIPLIAIVRRDTSSLVNAADYAFVLPEIEEASPVGAPTTSTTMMLAWGDCLAMALLHKKGFSKDDFGVFHPGGKLGAQFLTASELMKQGDDLPVVAPADPMAHALIVMTEKSLGLAIAVEKDTIKGIVTDGDLRRHMDDELVLKPVSEVMKSDPITIAPETLAAEALQIMNEKKITSLIVADAQKQLVGLLHIHDLLRAGV